MRITSRNENNYYEILHSWTERHTFEDIHKEELAIQKLGQLEDIEEELGIDLLTLFKALRQFFAKDLDCYCPRPTILFQDVHDEWYIGWCNHYYKLKDCGKTWALTKKELL